MKNYTYEIRQQSKLIADAIRRSGEASASLAMDNELEAYSMMHLLAERAQVFELPLNGIILDTDNDVLGETVGELGESYHLPYPIVALEFETDFPARRCECPDCTGEALGPTSLTMLLMDMSTARDVWGEKGLFGRDVDVDIQGETKGILVMPIFGDAVHPDTIASDIGSRHSWSPAEIIVLRHVEKNEQGQWGWVGGVVQSADGVLHGIDDPIPAFWTEFSDFALVVCQFLFALSCSNVFIEDVRDWDMRKFNDRAAKKGIPLADAYKILTIEPFMPKAKAGFQGGTHASPRQHLRRGHIRRWPTKDELGNPITKRIWINSMVVGDPSRGKIVKEYVVKGL